MANNAGTGLLRDLTMGHQRVTFIELFFDLVFVFAITQLSHTLLEHLTVRGALQTLLLLLAVWWAWIYTVWMTNWLDPEQRAVRIALIVLMLLGLLMSTSLSEAFGDRGLVFAAAFVSMAVGRSLFILHAFRNVSGQFRNFQRIITWQASAGVFWLAGGFADGAAREALWVAAIAIEIAGPAVGFRVPRLGRSYTSEWAVAGDHFAERCELFLILALGESILVTGATISGQPFEAWTAAAFVVAFIGSVAFWWVYFDRGAQISTELLVSSTDSGHLARTAYTYFHLPMVAGIIVAAVGDELTIAHPQGTTDVATTTVVLGGPILFLAGHALFKWTMFERVPISRLIGIGVLIGVAPVASIVSPVALAVCATAVVIAVAISDTRHYRALDGVPRPAPSHD